MRLQLGQGMAECRKCGDVFSSASAFDRHQRQRGDRVTCLDPAARGLVVLRHTKDGTPVWGKPPDQEYLDSLSGREPQRRLGAARVKIPGTSTTDVVGAHVERSR